MEDLYLIYFDETGTERESIPFQGRWSDLTKGIEHAQSVLAISDGREVWGYEVHGALVWDNAMQREVWRGIREGSKINEQRWSDWMEK
jgi:hypothetical protein